MARELISCQTAVPDSEALYKSAVEQLQEFAIFVIDPHGCISTWNGGVQRILGYTQQEFIGKPMQILFTPEDVALKVPEKELAQAARAGRANGEGWRVRKDSSRFYCEGMVTAITDDGGRPLGFTKIMRDTTARRALEKDLHDLTVALEQVQVLIRDMSGRIQFWSAGAERLYGYSKDEALGTVSHELLRTHFPQPLADIEAELRKCGSWQGELRHRHKDGRRIVVKSDWVLRPNSSTVVEANSDLTERRAAEDALRLSEDRFRKAFQDVPIGMGLSDVEGRLSSVNHAYCEILGYTPEELTQTDILSLTHPDDVPRSRELYLQLVKREIPSYLVEKRYLRKDGKSVWVRAAATIMHEEQGRPVQVVGIVEDIQDRKAAESALLQANEELSHFAYGVAHDLQAPLRGIRTYNQFLAKRYQGTLDSTADEFIRFINDSTESMQELIQALLRYAEAGELEIVREPVPTASVVEGVALALHADIEEAGAKVTWDELPTVDADRVRLTQLFQNLIGNALKYRKEMVAPEVHISASERPGKWLFSISDNGLGIDPRHHERIFEPLKRLHGRDIPGTGIGLAVCQKIVEQHGGRLWVESAPEKGSVFYFTLPCR